MKTSDLPSERYPDAPGFFVATSEDEQKRRGGVLLCPTHADEYMASGRGLYVTPKDADQWRAWARVSLAVNHCYQCNVNAGGRVV